MIIYNEKENKFAYADKEEGNLFKYRFRGYWKPFWREAKKEDFLEKSFKTETLEEQRKIEKLLHSFGIGKHEEGVYECIELELHFRYLNIRPKLHYNGTNCALYDISHEFSELFPEETTPSLYGESPLSKLQELSFKTIEDNKMNYEELKKFNKNNLKAGREQAKEERANYEAQQAKKAYTTLTDMKEQIERDIRERQEQLLEIEENLKLFK